MEQLDEYELMAITKIGGMDHITGILEQRTTYSSEEIDREGREGMLLSTLGKELIVKSCL